MRHRTRHLGLRTFVRRLSSRSHDGPQQPRGDGRAPSRRRWLSAWAALALASTTTVSGMVVGAAPASAATPEYEIKGAWLNQPDTISRGEPVVAEWRVNVNDAENPPSNEPVDNVVVEFTLDKAFFDEIPDICLTETADPPVDPASSISEDGTTLTCNLGTIRMGTAVVVQAPVVANGTTGEEVVGDGTIDGQTEELPPIPIVNPFIMDMQFEGTTEYRGLWNDTSDPRYVDIDLNWSLRLGQGSDVGPDEVTYRLDVGSNDGDNVNVGVDARTGDPGCNRFDYFNADGHPWSRTDIVPPHPASYRNTNFVDQCILTEVSEGVFTLTLRGINYDILNAPTHDSWNAPLDSNWDYVAAGSLWFRVFTTNAGSISLDSNEPLYEAPTGQLYRDLAGNNVTNKPYTLPGSFSSAYLRGFTGNGGLRWDNTYRTSPGTTVQHYVANGFSTDDPAGNPTYGNCLVFDYQYVRWDPNPPAPAAHGPIEVLITHGDGTYEWLEPPPGQVQYYVGPAPGNPDQFDCGSDPSNWTTTPADPNAVKAVRHLYPYSTYEAYDANGIQLRAYTKINEGLPVGTDIWQFGSALRSTGWVGPGVGGEITPTPGDRYPFTTGRRDVLHTITATPFIRKEAAKSTVTAGVPADFTLTYSATGSGSIPDTVDGYQIVDTLPVGMTYEPGSADPEPAVSTDAQGRQVLTWALDGVATNVDHELTYQAVADSSVEPGTRLTNTAVSSLEGVSSTPASDTVTTTTNGYTTILKTSDVEFIPNEKGDGVGSGSWTVTIESFDPLPQAFTDTIDILPYNGDQRGTSYGGTYTLDEMVAPDGATVYYTDADPSTLSDDPADESNGIAGDPTGSEAGWTTDRPSKVTAIRVIGPELESGGTFSFQVPITTHGASPGDTFVNRAQARAEHTELVMRTSASLTVTDYLVEKTSDPEPGSEVKPGDKVTYTVTVKQQGDVPAGAHLTDHLADVFDDATYNEDVATDLGEVTLDGDLLRWRGTIPVGGTATITYSVTVDETDDPSEIFLKNVVTSPGCYAAIKCTTQHTGKGRFEVSKTSNPKTGSTVEVGDVVKYKVRIAQRGEGPVDDAKIVDDLSQVLDDATFNNDIEATAGKAHLDGRKLKWTGDLEVGDVVKLTYSVTVTDTGDDELLNVVTPKGPGTCVPAPDENPNCTTRHQKEDETAPPPDDGGELPDTGSGISGLTIGGAVMLVLLGSGAVMLARRRGSA